MHSLEHGSVWVTYRPELPTRQVDQLRAVVQNNYLGTERYVLLSPYPGQKAAVVATAWGAQRVLTWAGDPDLVAFIRHFELGPQARERRAYCYTNGVGSPLA